MGASHLHRLLLPEAAFRAPDFESFSKAFSNPASIDSMPFGLVSFR
jgi:hypothetical protein